MCSILDHIAWYSEFSVYLLVIIAMVHVSWALFLLRYNGLLVSMPDSELRGLGLSPD